LVTLYCLVIQCDFYFLFEVFFILLKQFVRLWGMQPNIIPKIMNRHKCKDSELSWIRHLS